MGHAVGAAVGSRVERFFENIEIRRSPGLATIALCSARLATAVLATIVASTIAKLV